MGKEFFVSGIDTDCGKTYITGLLAYHLKKAGKEIITMKLAQTGCVGVSDDLKDHRWAMEIPLQAEDKDGITCPYVFSYPASPHLAAKIDASKIEIPVLRRSADELLHDYELLLTEGAGGLMVPLQETYLTVDYIKDFDLPLILVVSSKLGSINHALLSLELCKQKGLDLKFLVYNFLPKFEKPIAEDAEKIIRDYALKLFPDLLFLNSKDLEKSADAFASLKSIF